ncbi:alpha-N-acetylglucosaminidase [Pedobacter sp. LMG 31464]|uniref:Alpha-N-acetylglucosaminidase n=1 Tax=Pedobacter planticolens TaxID=2679964 RepID=A0A923IWM7_9SPHI|nr:alpha-N-acetylglucosaminidase [Pedobacter planticolens]MBB2147073.1 alpha-N-acetylglucosaminidase [Pedobacter planticolens]
MKILTRITLIALFLFFSSLSFTYAQDFSSVKAIAQRRVPWLASALKFSKLASTEKDVFELSADQKNVYIAASNANAASQALGWYLKYYCHKSLSHMGDNLSAPKTLPILKNKVRISSPYRFRYALNYCTINYSMSFYTWADWEKELDWMALNGVNLMLAPVGMEAVWQNTLKKVGYTQDETLAFIPGPAFSAWWLMGNLEGWGGPVTQQHINKQVLLEQQILKRMAEVGIEPVMHGFYGMIPTSLKQKLKIEVVSQGKWAGGFARPDFLNPSDPQFAQIANIYYDEMRKLYGKNLHYFGGDPFHEGGSSAGLDVSLAASKIQETMQFNFPNSTWVLQGWGANPSTKLLAGLNKKNALIIELFGENTSNYEKTKAYQGTPFIWSNVSNFGEKNGVYGRLQRFADEIYKAKNSEYGPYLSGVGIIPEGIYNNPVAYDLMLELGWHDEKVDVSKWLNQYQLYRYGPNDATVSKAWQQLLATAYNSPTGYQEGPSESVLCARPALDIKTVSSWGTITRNYDTLKFKEAVRLFVLPANKFRNSETYQVDRIDFVRQVLANKALNVYQQMCNAIKAKDVNAFKQNSKLFTMMILKQDALLGNNQFFTVNRWLKQAKNMAGIDAVEQTNALKNAKVQITYWGADNPETNLRDYANKEWNGILGSLYLDRWKKFINYQLELMDGKEAKVPDYFTMEKEWSESKEMFEPKKLNEKELNSLITEIMK